MSKHPLNNRRLFQFTALHALLLSLVVLMPKVLKSLALAEGLGFGSLFKVLLPDLFFVVFAELVFVALSLWWSRSFIRVIWSLLIIPAMLMSIVEHRFYLATGSILDWQLLRLGVRKISELKGVISAEIPMGWWLLMAASLPIALVLAALSTRFPVKRLGRAGPAALAGALVGLLLLTVGTSSLPVDPRVLTLRGNLYLNLLTGYVLRKQSQAPLEAAALDFPLGEPVVLQEGPNFEGKNVVIVILESVRAQSVTPYNSALDTTPFLQKIASEGIVVQDAYTTIPHTTKSLVPILCGVTPDIRQALTETTPDAIPVACLPKLLSSFGYSSAFFQPATEAFEQRPVTIANAGFETFVAEEHLDPKGFRSPNYLGLEDNAMLEPILEWAEAQEGPFLLSLLTLITHHNYKLPRGFPKKSYEGVDERVNSYYNTLRYSDQFLQSLIEGLEQRGLVDDTLFVFMGDHGEAHGEHGRKGHDEVMYQEGVKVPLILWSPSMIKGHSEISGLRQNVDLLPTITEMLGLEVKQGRFDGVSLFEPVDDRVLHFSCWYTGRCMGRIEGSDKFIYYYDKRPNERFDLSLDPGETNNTAASMSPKTVRAYVEGMERWREDARSRYATHLKVRNSEYIYFEEPLVPNELQAKLGIRLNLLGYGKSPAWSPGKPATFDTYYEVLSNIGWHWKLRLRLVDSAGVEHEIEATTSQSQYPPYTWVPGQFRKADFEFTLPEAVAPGPAILRMRIQGMKAKLMKVTGPGADPEVKAVAIPVQIVE